MDDNFDELVIEVRASTQGFNADLENIRGAVDTNLLEGFSKAGNALERSLLTALRKGSLGFDDLKSIAFRALDDIASHALEGGLSQLFGSSGGSAGLGGLGGLFTQALGGLFGLPGRATGGSVSPGRGFIVGENGPELFVPTSAGRVERSDAAVASGRDVRVAINVAAPRGTSAPVAMRRSSRQVAAAVRQALQDS